MPQRKNRIYDVLVLGGGPAGACAGAMLARCGRRVAILEREPFPRFHIGESLLPETQRYLEAVGVFPKVASEGFMVKRGGFFLSADGSFESYIDFGSIKGSLAQQTYEVRRDRFDALLLENAAEQGAEVRQPCRVADVEVHPTGVTVRCDSAAGSEELHAQAVIDATGRSGIVARKLGVRRHDPELRNVAIHCRYRGVVPPPDDRQGDLRVVALDGAGWIWLIPLSETLTSVGVVVPRASLAAGTPAECLAKLFDEVPIMEQLLAGATQVDEVHLEADYSYDTSAYAGDRWLLAGDAGSFLDPIFSTGLLLALKSGVEGAQALDKALAGGTFRHRALANYDRDQRRTYRLLRRLVVGFYQPAFRDLLLQPANHFGLFEALGAVLTGQVWPPLPTRLRLSLFHVLARLQRRYALVPRVFSRTTAS